MYVTGFNGQGFLREVRPEIATVPVETTAKPKDIAGEQMAMFAA